MNNALKHIHVAFDGGRYGRRMLAMMSVLLSIKSVVAQNDAARFDAISVKSNKLDPRARSVKFGCNGSRFILTGSSIARTVLWAFDIKIFQLIGLPRLDDPREELFDIEAVSAGALTDLQCKAMVRNLLVDRFQLAFHNEQRDIPAYALVVAPKGPRVNKVLPTDHSPNGGGFTVNGSTVPIRDPNLPGWTMEELADSLSIARLERPVFDHTGLGGVYKIALKFDRAGTIDGQDPDVTTALEEQLGLRLEPSKERIKVIVIDRMSRPSPN
jgi:uncharacterized protein (TIGR03435 family)